MILDQNIAKNSKGNGVQWKINYIVVVKGGYFKSQGINGGHFLTEEIYAYEEQDIMVMDVPNSFIKTNIPPT